MVAELRGGKLAVRAAFRVPSSIRKRFPRLLATSCHAINFPESRRRRSGRQSEKVCSPATFSVRSSKAGQFYRRILRRANLCPYLLRPNWERWQLGQKRSCFGLTVAVQCTDYKGTNRPLQYLHLSTFWWSILKLTIWMISTKENGQIEEHQYFSKGPLLSLSGPKLLCHCELINLQFGPPGALCCQEDLK